MNQKQRLLNVLRDLAVQFCDERIGQVIVNVAIVSRPPRPIRTTDAADSEFCDAAIRRILAWDGYLKGELTDLRREIVEQIAMLWLRSDERFGTWISRIASTEDEGLIDISDEDLLDALRKAAAAPSGGAVPPEET